MNQTDTPIHLRYNPSRLFCRLLLVVVMLATSFTLSQAQWQTAISGTGQQLLDVSYGVGQWVAVGLGGTILTSPDGVTWQAATSGTTQTLKAVTYGNGQWLAVGLGGTVLSSSDAVTWTSNPLGTAPLADVVYGGGQWMTSDDLGKIRTSPDGLTWTLVYSSSVSLNIAYGAGQWVATDLAGKIVTSSNTTSWRTTYLIVSGRQYFTGITYGGGLWIAVGGTPTNNGLLLAAPDGSSWGGRAVPQDQQNYFQDVGYGESQWIAVGSSGRIIVSTNGTDWTPQTAITGQQLSAVSYGNGKFVAVGDGGTIIYKSLAALPVSLVSFAGQAEGTTANLSWQTAWEKGASHFLVERSTDAKSFEPIGRIEAQGTTTTNQQYRFIDPRLASGLYYYRLRQVDLDGSFTHSQVIAVRVGSEALETLTLSPNPSWGPMLLEYKKGIKSVGIYSLTGALIEQHEFTKAVDKWSWAGADQPAGVYVIQVETQDGKSSSLRWIRQ